MRVLSAERAGALWQRRLRVAKRYARLQVRRGKECCIAGNAMYAKTSASPPIRAQRRCSARHRIAAVAGGAQMREMLQRAACARNEMLPQ